MITTLCAFTSILSNNNEIATTNNLFPQAVIATYKWAVLPIFWASYGLYLSDRIYLKYISPAFNHNTHYPDPNKDAVIVTGGGSLTGLGRFLTKEFVRAGFHVIILDVQFTPSSSTNTAQEEQDNRMIHFIKCDVSDYNQVSEFFSETWKAILPSGIYPTVLINNAGIVSNETLIEQSPQMIQKTINVNLIAAFWTCKSIINNISLLRNKNIIASPGNTKSIPQGISIVNVSSVLGTVGPARLTAYSASKAGLILFHESLTHEIGEPYYTSKSSNSSSSSSTFTSNINNNNNGYDFPINTLLVLPGQLDTTMFNGVETPSSFFAPVVPTEKLAKLVVDKVLKGETGVFSTPFYTHFSWATRIIPGIALEAVRKLIGMDKSMNGFKKSAAIESKNK